MLEFTTDQIQVGMVARNGEAMLDFYGNTLGLPLVQTLELPMGNLNLFALGNNVVKVLVPQTPPPHQDTIGEPGDASGIRYWTATVKNLDALIEHCCQGGATQLGETGQVGNVRYALLNDPDGNCLEFIEMVES